MKKFNRKRLDNKGFTLIELLAVVVILAVVMGIAMTSVLSSMNNSRKGSLQDSAKSVAQAVQTKYSEALITNDTDDVFSDVLEEGNGYNFTSKGFYTLATGLKDELNLSPSTYVLNDGGATPLSTTTKDVTQEDGSTKNVPVLETDKSFIYYDGNRFTVCLIAQRAGSYFVANAATEATTEIDGITVFFKDGTKDDSGNDLTTAMWSCSTDGEYSWK